MTESNKLSYLLATVFSLTGCIVAGMLLAPKKGNQNHKWVLKQASRISSCLSRQSRRALGKTSQSFYQFRAHVQAGIKHNIPDLFEATSQLTLTEDDLRHA